MFKNNKKLVKNQLKVHKKFIKNIKKEIKLTLLAKEMQIK